MPPASDYLWFRTRVTQDGPLDLQSPGATRPVRDVGPAEQLLSEARELADRASANLQAGNNAEVDLKRLDEVMRDYNSLLFGSAEALKASVLPVLV